MSTIMHLSTLSLLIQHCCTTSFWLQQQKASLFFRKRTERLLHCSQACTASKAPALGKHWCFLFRTLQFLATLPGLGANLLTSSRERPLSVANARCVHIPTSHVETLPSGFAAWLQLQGLICSNTFRHLRAQRLRYSQR